MHDAGIQVFREFPLAAAQTEMNLSLRMMALSENRHRKTPQAFASSVDDDAQLPAFGVWKSGERNERVLSPHSGSRIYGLLLLPSRSVACARTGVCNLLADALNHFSRCNTMRVCVCRRLVVINFVESNLNETESSSSEKSAFHFFGGRKSCWSPYLRHRAFDNRFLAMLYENPVNG